MTEAVVQISPTTLPLSTAQALVEAAVARAQEAGIPYVFAVLDGGGHLVQLTRMDGAALAALDSSVAKARTAVHFGAATADLVAMVQPGGPLFTIASGATLPLVFVAGGIPVKDAGGLVVGALGAAGGSPRQDHDIAVAAAGSL
ncbi:heme-binding protein [Actinoplanes sp. NPDC049598]|uniref:GlcG/HbpS family heme-binding protein n=1 Tax=Actinoplanes sp. NPDC049598 TaxID=3154626 RepID=UPI00344607E3